MVEDNHRHKGLRTALINELRKKGTLDERVLEVMESIPRHIYMDSAFLEQAYENKPFPIGSGQTISQPYTVAFQTTILEVNKGDKILEIGTGSGYQTAVLVKLGAKVVTIERHKALYRKAKNLLNKQNLKALCLLGDGFEGNIVNGPYDGILVTCGAPHIPKKLLEQLKPQGRLVVPLGSGGNQTMYRMSYEDGHLKKENFGMFSFVPMLPNIAK